jgi:glutamate/aspartate transport system substrate-binding protein
MLGADMKTLTCLLVSFSALLVATAGQAAHAGTLETIKPNGVINIGARDASIPFSYVTASDGKPMGYSVDICNKIADAVKARLGNPNLKVNYTIVTPVNRQALIQNGTIDIECSTATNTLARQEQVDFSPTVFEARETAAVRKNSGINSFSDFNGKTISTASGSTAVQLLRMYKSKNNLDTNVIFGKDVPDSFLMMTAGRASAYVQEDVLLAGQIANSSTPNDFRILDGNLQTQPFAFMFRKNDPEFKKLVDDTIHKMASSGELNQLYAKWFTRPIPPKNLNLNFPLSAENEANFKNPSSTGIQ